MSPWLIVGLGNPGSQYAMTRHNIGFMSIDFLLKAVGSPREKTEMKGILAKFKWHDQDIICLKPQTFMNRSGESVQAVMSFYKISLENLIVVHDEIDQVFGKMKIQKNRGHGGHNGIRNITELLGSSDYLRLRLGVGRPENPHIPVADYVLQSFYKEESLALSEFLNKSVDAIESMILDGMAKAATKFNS